MAEQKEGKPYSMGYRMAELWLSQILCALGIYMTVQANVGLAPWDAFSMGCSNVTGLRFGTVGALSGAVIVGMDLLMKQPLGLGTLVNTFVAAMIINVFDAMELIPLQQSYWTGIPMLLVGMELNCISTYYYIHAGMGCGPRDGLMVALGQKLRKVPIGLVRFAIEMTVLAIGWALGAKVGIGTVLGAFGMGFCLEQTFRFFHFDVRSIHQENLLETWQKIRPRLPEQEKEQQQNR